MLKTANWGRCWIIEVPGDVFWGQRMSVRRIADCTALSERPPKHIRQFKGVAARDELNMYHATRLVCK